ncbi:DNA alkylation repair protein [Mariniflexile sp. AS56]|uniref:DNA alkylation repair protein n=1 Tax=Mariniflexile sp. AS56 TaxID=3063957 RepID=UPI0026F04A5E|nr:DNA alkylation repair protein [Mariniflexile sp. AS56]MDO7170608.1 DNA alkylation repair protein [Mariniflexile sp. AS56]
MTANAFKATLEIIGLEYAKGIPKRELFSLAKEYQHMPVMEVVTLLQDENDDYRLAAVSILDWKARNIKTTEGEKEAVYKAYIDNYIWIDNWGLVDRAAPYVVGGYLFDKDRKPLYDLAKSNNAMERRTAIVSTYYFIRKKDVEDTFKIAEILVNDSDLYVQKAVGSWLREAGKQNEGRLREFLDRNAVTMPRITLRYAIDKLEKQERNYYLNLKNDM